jgi:hypothetical protein
MTFGYALLGALVLLLPGFAGYYGMRLGETGGLLTLAPDRPNSNFTIFMVVLFALVAHVIGSALFAINEVISHWVVLVHVAYDPNPYRALWSGQVPSRMSGPGFTLELTYLLLLTAGMVAGVEFIAKRIPSTTLTAPLGFGWLLPIAKQVEAGSHIVIGYVMTTTGHDGAWIAYQGMVRRLALNDDDAIEMIVLEQCDRFVVRIVDGKVERVDTDAQTIELIHLRNTQVANYALEVIEVSALA